MVVPMSLYLERMGSRSGESLLRSIAGNVSSTYVDTVSVSRQKL